MAVEHKIKGGIWDGWDLPKLYRKASLPLASHPEVFDYVRSKGKVIFSTPFDRRSVDYLERLDCPMYKVASFELVDLELLRYIAQTGKPMILSTGQVSTGELAVVMGELERYDNHITLLHCVSQYPTEYKDVNLNRMVRLKAWGHPVGLSDHSPGSTVPIAAAALGATMIEKHVCLRWTGLDKRFAMPPWQFNAMAKQVRDAWDAMGDDVDREKDTSMRRSLYYRADMPSGTRVTEADLKTARPNQGLCPLQAKKILGRELTEDVVVDQPVLLAHAR
jgi:N-acetylneuraminate synthase